MMYKAVLIDIDDTLLDFGACAKECMRLGFADWDLPFSEASYQTFKRINDGLWRDLEAGLITKPELFGIRFERIFDALGVIGNGGEFEKLFRHYLFDAAFPVEGAPELLEYLSSRYTLYAVSNGAQVQQTNRLNRAGMLSYFADVMTSERMGYPKPNREFFDGVFAQIPETPAECVLLGDSVTADMIGGVQYGLQTIWFNRTGRVLPGTLRVDHEIHALSEIGTIL